MVVRLVVGDDVMVRLPSPPWAKRSSSAVSVPMLCRRRTSLSRLVFIDLSFVGGRSNSRAKRDNFFPSASWAALPWDDRRMEPQDNPEDRIRELERSLTDQASTSELGTAQSGGNAAPPTPPPA